MQTVDARARLACCLLAMSCSVLTADVSPASQIAPGDVIYADSRGDWFRYRPSSNELVWLDWEPANSFALQTVLDIDGHLLIPSRAESIRINPATGRAESVSFATPNADRVALTDSGDYLQSGLGQVRLYSRDQQTRFWTASVFAGSSGDLEVVGQKAFASYRYGGVFEIDLATGQSSQLIEPRTQPIAQPYWIEPLSNGNLVVEDIRGSLFLYDPLTREAETFVSFFDLPTDANGIINSVEVDELDRLWIGSGLGLFTYDSSGGGRTQVSVVETSVRLLTLVPSDWTPPVPEPASSVALATVLFGLSSHRRRSAA